MAQYALPLDTRDATASTRIVVGAANASVIEALADPSHWPFHVAVLVGPPRSGKTLLARHFAATACGEAIDDAHDVEETTLFHRWNRAQDDGSPLLLCAREGWRITLPDLASRLGGSLQLGIGAPDDAMVRDLIEAHAEQRHLALSDAASAYLVPRIERSFAAIEAVVAAIDRISLERQLPATMSIWRDALESVQGPEQASLL
ncbi:ATPase [Porphyrobacter algicida]|uniref:ATPase n=1 Tax=Qipengyuania algicida TaxID=1836209 RepID=A0A845AH26_9SPHN|nr:ATPase [Qipengyuania algicida]MXP28739.1 ATPase [Qipengyuania algicida]